jgi:sterol desaturase/sphingolipid hydroxylase (fatty acid hydroxylase superfamily)
VIALQVLLAYIYSHFVEYFAHKFLHLFKKKKHLLSFHLRDHHVNAKRNNMYDSPSVREAALILSLTLTHLPLLYFAPYAFATLVFCALDYIYVHYRAHIDLAWAKENVPWHIDHHIGNQQANWGVRKDWIDKLFKTKDVRKNYAKGHEQKTR